MTFSNDILNEVLHDVERRFNKKMTRKLSHTLENDNPLERRTINDRDLPDDIEISIHPDLPDTQHTYLSGEDYHASHEKNYEGLHDIPLGNNYLL